MFQVLWKYSFCSLDKFIGYLLYARHRQVLDIVVGARNTIRNKCGFKFNLEPAQDPGKDAGKKWNHDECCKEQTLLA